MTVNKYVVIIFSAVFAWALICVLLTRISKTIWKSVHYPDFALWNAEAIVSHG